ncbi:MAG: transcription termination factor NusA [Chloroflexota bacterium]
MKNEFVLAFNQVLEDKQLPKEVILEAIEAAMANAYRKAVGASDAQHVESKVNPETGKIDIFAEKEVVELVQDERTEVTLEEALKVDANAQLGNLVVIESTPKDFGRVAAQTARQVIQQRIREAERNVQYQHFAKQTGEIISGIAQAINNGNVTLGMDLSAEGMLGRKEQIPGERFRIHDRIRALLLDVKNSPRGPQITLSRAHRNFLRRLLENEVPEIYHGIVEIRSIAREPGYRSKVAVAALKPGIDPVGACVGIRGVRIQAIVRELHDEKIDVIEWNPDPKQFIAKALSPARVIGVYLDEYAKGPKTATVLVPEDQLSLAIGKDGQNARLSAKLTGWRIDIKSQIEAITDVLYKLQNNAEYAAMMESEVEVIPQVEVILGKKSEGRPITPEEYQTINKFIDRVESGVIGKRQETRRIKGDRLTAAQAKIPQDAFNIPLEEFDVSERIYELLSENGFTTVGELMLQIEMDPDVILKINGMGPKAMADIQTVLASLRLVPLEIEPEITIDQVPETETISDIPQPETESVEIVDISVASTELEEQPVVDGVVEIPSEEMETPSLETVVIENLDNQLSNSETVKMDQEVTEEDVDLFGKKKKDKKKKFVEMEFDPDQGVVIVKRKRKRGGEWDNEEWLE